MHTYAKAQRSEYVCSELFTGLTKLRLAESLITKEF